MTAPTLSLVLDEPAMAPLASLIACELRQGDWVCLIGDLGAGKTTLARAIVRDVLGEPDAEVPSPTFSLVQGYETGSVPILHCDLYRLADAGEATELGLWEAASRGAVLIEWAERAPSIHPDDRLEIRLGDADAGRARLIELTGHGHWQTRVERLAAIRALLDRAGWADALARPLSGDASTRRYLRLVRGDETALLMDAARQPDGPPIRDGKPYSRIAHLAEDVRPFVAVARHLRSLGLAVPEITAMDLDAGLLLIEDLGDRIYGAELERGAHMRGLWSAAADALLVLRRAPAPGPLPIGDGSDHIVPAFDLPAMQIEAELLLEWYLPALVGQPAEPALRQSFLAAWQPVFDRLSVAPARLVLRDFHSPNLIALPDRAGAARVGIIDFQDALIAHPAYDLVSLLQDARLDVPVDVETELLAYYEDQAAAAEPDFDRAAFEFAYRAMGAQRNTKILGIFARLARRDGKPRYLAHIPRIWRYLERDLAHPGLANLRAWYDEHLPPAVRTRALTA
jgi:tRNA threonylcarbamoyl adenosine modification protein YjeE